MEIRTNIEIKINEDREIISLTIEEAKELRNHLNKVLESDIPLINIPSIWTTHDRVGINGTLRNNSNVYGYSYTTGSSTFNSSSGISFNQLLDRRIGTATILSGVI